MGLGILEDAVGGECGCYRPGVFEGYVDGTAERGESGCVFPHKFRRGVEFLGLVPGVFVLACGGEGGVEDVGGEVVGEYYLGGR